MQSGGIYSLYYLYREISIVYVTYYIEDIYSLQKETRLIAFGSAPIDLFAFFAVSIMPVSERSESSNILIYFLPNI